jgi:hypothetical protein
VNHIPLTARDIIAANRSFFFLARYPELGARKTPV